MNDEVSERVKTEFRDARSIPGMYMPSNKQEWEPVDLHGEVRELLVFYPRPPVLYRVKG